MRPRLPDPKFFVPGQSLVYDTFKHLTTLSTGSTLLLIALLDKLFAAPEWKPLVAVSFIGFIVTMSSSVIAMWIISSAIRDAGYVVGVENSTSGAEQSREEIEGLADGNLPISAYIGVSLIVTSYGSFLAGVVCLVVFALKNFF